MVGTDACRGYRHQRPRDGERHQSKALASFHKVSPRKRSCNDKFDGLDEKGKHLYPFIVSFTCSISCLSVKGLGRNEKTFLPSSGGRLLENASSA